MIYPRPTAAAITAAIQIPEQEIISFGSSFFSPAAAETACLETAAAETTTPVVSPSSGFCFFPTAAAETVCSETAAAVDAADLLF